MTPVLNMNRDVHNCYNNQTCRSDYVPQELAALRIVEGQHGVGHHGADEGRGAKLQKLVLVPGHWGVDGELNGDRYDCESCGVQGEVSAGEPELSVAEGGQSIRGHGKAAGEGGWSDVEADPWQRAAEPSLVQVPIRATAIMVLPFLLLLLPRTNSCAGAVLLCASDLTFKH